MAPATGLIGGAPPSDGVCLRHSATSCRPTRSAPERLISRASGTARSANLVLCNSFQTTPAPSIACAIPAALIAGFRSAPRNRLRVITVISGVRASAAGLNSAGSDTAAVMSMGARRLRYVMRANLPSIE